MSSSASCRRTAASRPNRFVEVHNPTLAPVDIGGLFLIMCPASTGDALAVYQFNARTVLHPGEYFTVAAPGDGPIPPIPGADAYEWVMFQFNNGDGAALSPFQSPTAGQTIDGVASDINSPCVEGLPTPALPADNPGNLSVQRAPDGRDVDNNLADFVRAPRTP